MKFSKLEQKIIDKQYGKDATPILHTDKSVKGLIAANCRKRVPSKWYEFIIHNLA